MNAVKFKVFVKNLLIAVSLLALANLPANAELLIGLSFPSQGGGDNDVVQFDSTDTFQIDESLLTLPKLHLQESPCPENRAWSSEPSIKFSTTYTKIPVYYPHQDTFFTNAVFPSFSYSFGPAKFDQNGSFATGVTIRQQLPPRSVSANESPNSSVPSDSSISSSALPIAPQPASSILTVTLKQNTLQLDWPTDRIGWILQTQTNAAINSQWLPVPGSSATNHLDLTLDRANTSVFFRLVAP